ncbi:hypothetical protein L1049_023591 [Liquidambar formosana]|uniref:Pre-nudix hydrolase domain-containing protein n=1 Tax=Liquidambar formosana TaxID=63359 RepID=A0AAP0RZR6_LIQFO
MGLATAHVEPKGKDITRPFPKRGDVKKNIKRKLVEPVKKGVSKMAKVVAITKTPKPGKVVAVEEGLNMAVDPPTSLLVGKQDGPDENGVQQNELPNARDDGYGGVRVQMKEPMDSQVFASWLRASLPKWKRQIYFGSSCGRPFGSFSIALAPNTNTSWPGASYKMSSAKFIMAKLIIFLLALWLSVSRRNCAQTEVYGDGITAPNACLNCTICPYPCHPQPPPPLGNPSYGAPSPPSGLGNCPETPVQCCRYSPLTPYTCLPYNKYSASQPLALYIKPPCTISSATFLLFLFEFVF